MRNLLAASWLQGLRQLLQLDAAQWWCHAAACTMDLMSLAVSLPPTGAYSVAGIAGHLAHAPIIFSAMPLGARTKMEQHGRQWTAQIGD